MPEDGSAIFWHCNFVGKTKMHVEIERRVIAYDY